MITPEHDVSHPTLHDDSAEEGWYALRQRTHHALTRFSPPPQGEETGDWRHASHWAVLAAELWETADSVELSLEIPGMQAEQLDVEILAGTLVVRGERIADENALGHRHFIRERAYGRFQRAFHLPATVDEDRARARYREGILRVSLPKSRGHADNRISVESGP